MHRRALGLIGLLLLLLASPAAHAAEPRACELTGGAHQEEANRAGLLAHPIAEEMAGWLGEQAAGHWVQARDGTWYLGIAPGPIGTEDARRHAIELVDARYDGEEAEFLRARLRMDEQPYGEPELRRIQAEIGQRWQARGWRVGSTVGVRCVEGVRRTVFELFSDATSEMVEEARRLVEPYGDRARFVHHAGAAPPAPDAGPGLAPPPPPAVRDLVRLRGCRIALRAAHRGAVRSLEVRAGRRRALLRGARLARGVRLRGRRAIVRIRFADGRTASGALRLRGCG